MSTRFDLIIHYDNFFSQWVSCKSNESPRYEFDLIELLQLECHNYSEPILRAVQLSCEGPISTVHLPCVHRPCMRPTFVLCLGVASCSKCAYTTQVCLAYASVTVDGGQISDEPFTKSAHRTYAPKSSEPVALLLKSFLWLCEHEVMTCSWIYCTTKAHTCAAQAESAFVVALRCFLFLPATFH